MKLGLGVHSPSALREGRSEEMAFQSIEKRDFALGFWVAQRFTAAITGLFSLSALRAAEKLDGAPDFVWRSASALR